jgi:arsenite-transporting ATPase
VEPRGYSKAVWLLTLAAELISHSLHFKNRLPDAVITCKNTPHHPTIHHTQHPLSIATAAMDLTDDLMEPTLQSILDQKSLRWIFVGGKGGVGKTTTSCSLAIQLARVRRSVLLISTDPAHNLSDAFNQKFGKDARLVNGFTNLSAMEIDPNGSMQDLLAGAGTDGAGAGETDNGAGGLGGMMQELSLAIPGIDEAMSFAEVLKQVKSLSYETIVFDTAPTGHTLRFLQFPSVLEKALAKVSQLSSQYGPLVSGLMGSGGGLPNGQNLNDMLSKLEALRETIAEVNAQFKDERLTTFVCVCIAEFLSLYETERMIQELASYSIDTHCIVVNQLLFPKKGSNCEQCSARRRMQKKYLDQIEDLYDEFNVVRMPLLVEEVRGKEKLEKFSEMLMKPFVPPDMDAEEE